jgi:hypothetical protein
MLLLLRLTTERAQGSIREWVGQLRLATTGGLCDSALLVPVARLAVSKQDQGRGMGFGLLQDAPRCPCNGGLPLNRDCGYELR